MTTNPLALYAALAAFRFLLALHPTLSQSYIHPDEFLQSPDVAAQLLFNHSYSTLPWEFNPAHLSRSYLTPLIQAALPLSLFGARGGPPAYVALRLNTLFISIISDLAFYHASRKNWNALLLRSSSWVALVLLPRSLSNSLELALLDLLLLIASLPSRYSRDVCALCGGLVVCLGVFCRITFPGFAAPVVLHMLLNERDFDVAAKGKKPGWTHSPVLRHLVFGALGFVLASVACVALDSRLVHRLALAPLNNLAYNLNSDNLAQHGLHPRYTHVVVNAQLLFGPQMLLAFIRAFGSSASPIERMHGRIICLSLAVLSLFPHQEPRFLLPLLSSVALLSHSWGWPSARLLPLHLVLNLALALFFSCAHQGGIVRAVQTLPAPCCVAGLDIYPLPRSLVPVAEATRIADFMAGPVDSAWIESCRRAGLAVYIVLPRAAQSRLPSPPLAAHVVTHIHFNAETGGGGLQDLLLLTL